MKKILMIAAFGLLSIASANAQLKGGSFGIGASFSHASEAAQLMYAASSNLDFMLMLGYTSTSVDNPEPLQDPESVSAMTFGLGLRYFLRDGDVSPYLGALVTYSSPVKDDKIIGINAVFGGQAFVTKNVGIYSHIGLGIGMETETITTTGTGGPVSADKKTTVITLFTAAVGAAFYF